MNRKSVIPAATQHNRFRASQARSRTPATLVFGFAVPYLLAMPRFELCDNDVVPSLPAQSLSIHGVDAVAFAQAQFSSQVTALAPGYWQFSAWLDPQGRVRAFFHLARMADDRLLLLLRGGDATAMTASLQRFVFRAKVMIETLPTRALGTGLALPLHACSTEAGATRFGCGDHSMHLGTAVVADGNWRLRQIRAGWPWLPESALDQLLPPALALAALGATALDKGCYPGQEMVARLHYRGGHKRSIRYVTLSQFLTPGTLLRHAGRDVIRILDCVACAEVSEALAVIDDEIAVELESGLSLLHEGCSVIVRAGKREPDVINMSRE